MSKLINETFVTGTAYKALCNEIYKTCVATEDWNNVKGYILYIFSHASSHNFFIMLV